MNQFHSGPPAAGTLSGAPCCVFFVALRESQHPEEAAVTLLFLNKNQCFQFLRLRPAGLEDSRCGSNTRPEDQQVCEGPGQRPGPGRSLEHEVRRWEMQHLQPSFLEVPLVDMLSVPLGGAVSTL